MRNETDQEMYLLQRRFKIMSSDERLLNIVMSYREKLQKKIQIRKKEMEEDNNDHYMIYNALKKVTKLIINKMLVDSFINMLDLC